MTRRDERDTIKFSLRSHCDWEQAAGTETKHDRKEQWVVKHQNEFPRRLRTAIEAKSSKGLSSQAFLSQIKLEFEEWIFASIGTGTSAGTSAGVDTTDGTEPPRGGLNDRVDTEEEVELALRCFPEVLTSRRRGLYPIFWLSKSVHSVSFIPLFATLGEELGLFQEFERGGLVFGGNYITVFSQLAAGTSNAHHHHHHHHHHDGTNDGTNDDNDLYHRYHRLVDDKFLAVLKRLRENKLMRRKDIRPNDLIGTLNQQVVFPEQRFRYLVDWDPRNTLLKTDGNALSWDLVSKYILDSEVLSPRYTQTQTQTHTVGNSNSSNNNNNNKDRVGTAGIEMLFELAVRYFPVEMGFLFHQYDVKRKRHQRGVDETNFHNRRCRKYTLSRGSSPPREEHNRTTPPSTTTTTTTIATFTTRSTTTITTATTKKTIIAKTTTTITKTTTPYRIACEKFGIARVNAILQDALDRNAAINNNGRTEASSSTRSSSSSSSGTITKDCDCDCSALVYAASEQRVDLDCVYILLQRNPAFCKVQ